MDNVTIKEVINIAYRHHELIQNPIEIYDFAKFYSELNCKNVLEIGTFYGGTFYLLCKLSNDIGKKVSVDFPVNENSFGPDLNKVNQISLKLKTFSSNVEVFSMDSHSTDTVVSVEKAFNGEEVDFIFIDGDHSYEGVKKDYEMYKHLLKDGGYIAFHDINFANQRLSSYCKVDVFWNELIKDENINFIEFNQKSSGGIGVVQVFKNKKKLDLEVEYERPNKITISNNSHHNLDLIVSVRDAYSKIPIYFCDVNFSSPGTSWWILPIGSYDWYSDPYVDSLVLEFYDREKNLLDTKKVKIKENSKKLEKIGTRIYSAFDCLWINYKQMFIEKIYDKLDIHNLNTVIDIGANVGIFSNYITECGAKVVHAIEPSNKAFDELKNQFYYYNSVKCHKIGIGGKDELKTIFVNNDNSTICSFLSKTSENVSEEAVNVKSLQTFYNENSISKIDLVKIDVEGMEYEIIENSSDETLLLSDRYLIEYHMNESGHKLSKLISKLKNLGYEIDTYPDVPSNVQGFIFAKKKYSKKNKKKNNIFPKRAFITFTNEYYLPLTEKLVQSLAHNSIYPIIVYSINCDIKFSYPNMIVKRIDSEIIKQPLFEIKDFAFANKRNEIVEVELPKDSIGIVNRNDYGTYTTLSRKPQIILDAIQNGLSEGIFLDADGIAKENIDTAFDYLTDCTDYPIVGRGLFEYMMLNGIGSPFDGGDTLEKPLMDLINVKDRTMHYVSSNFIIFTDKMNKFIKEWAELADHKTILENNDLYAPYHDETLLNVLLWKVNATKQLPIVHYNLTNAKKAEEFYNTDIRNNLTDSDWHFIPDNINDIKYFHGCKSISEISSTIQYINSRKDNNKFNYNYKKYSFSDNSKIAIVSLFDDNYKDLANISIPNKIEYASKHGYDLFYFDTEIDKSRPPQWSKIKAVEYLLNDYEWVWWIDIDALVINMDIKLEEIIDNNYDIIFTENKYSVISNGSSFYKNSNLSKKFLHECYTLNREILRDVNVNVFDHEQQPMRKLYQHDLEYNKKIKLIPERVCNSYWYTYNQSVLQYYPNWNNEENIYKDGDFVVNFCGRTKEERIDIMKNFFVQKNDK